MDGTFVDCLPVELIIEILIKTDGKTVGKCRRVCKKWKSIIDNTDLLWEKICFTEFQHPSRIAKEKRHSECRWYHIYRNFVVWNNVTGYEVHLREFHDFPLCAVVKRLNSVISDDDQVVEDTMSLIACFLFERNRPKIDSNDHALVVFFKYALVIIRPGENTEYRSERIYRADGYSLSGNKLYFYRNYEVFECDLSSKDLQSKLFYNSDYNNIIKGIQHYNGQTFLFTNCGKIVIISSNNVRVQPINCPKEWINRINHICAINNRNYICYSRTLFQIETDKYRHIYLFEIPLITALFFYGDFVLLGTKSGEILLYRQSSQKSKPLISPPTFEFISQLPGDHFAVQLDVSERKSGPVIIVTTMYKIMFLEIDFFPDVPTDFARLRRREIFLKDEN